MSDDDGGLEAIQLLVNDYPETAMQRNSNGDLPIHFICGREDGVTLAMVRALLSAYPDAIVEKGYRNMKPYTLAVDENCLPEDAIAFLKSAEKGQSSSPPLTLSV